MLDPTGVGTTRQPSHDGPVSEDWARRWNSGAKTFYVAEIIRQSTYALTALDQAVHIVQGQDQSSEPWPAVQAFLTGTANVSKMLWPGSKRKNETVAAASWRKFRGERLRAELEVADSSVLKGRGVRNSAEHFDERIDDLVRGQQIPESWTALQDENFARLPPPSARPADARRADCDRGRALPQRTVAGCIRWCCWPKPAGSRTGRER